MTQDSHIRLFLFDFGGVIAEEGFREGLRAIARNNRLDENAFTNTSYELIHASGYLLGKATEHDFWSLVREQTHIQDSDQELSNECLSRFILRNWMLKLVQTLRHKGFQVAILSDQTDWLDSLDRKYQFFKYFERVFNSYHMGKGKRSPDHFDDIVRILGFEARETLFIDDDQGNCERASQRGLYAIHYRDKNDFLSQFVSFCPSLEADIATL